MIPHQSSRIDPTESCSDTEKQQHCYSEDVSPLRKSEKIAWFIQNSTICGFGWIAYPAYVPMVVMDVSLKNGVQVNNHTQPCDTSVANPACVTNVFGLYLDPGTISLYFSSFCSVLAFLCSMSLAPVADRGAYRKRFMIVFSIIGGLSAGGFLMAEIPHLYRLIGVLAPVSWVCYNIVNTLSHAYLPIFGRVDPHVLAVTSTPGVTEHEVIAAEERALNDLSAYSNAYAGLGSLTVQGVCIATSHFMHDSSLSLKISIAFAGAWWALWQLAVSPWMRTRPGPSLDKGTNWLVYSWKSNLKTLASARQLPQIFKYMLAWFLVSDGIGTMQATNYLIAYRELGFTHTNSMVLSFMVEVLSSFTSYLLVPLRRWLGLSTKTLVMVTLWGFLTLLLYLSITPLMTSQYGLRSKVEVYAVVIYTGLFFSPFYGTLRVMLSELAPPGDESKWFSMYLLADKGSSWIGPLVAAWIFEHSHQYRLAFWFPTALFVAGILVMWRIDVPKGREEAQVYAEKRRKQLGLAF